MIPPQILILFLPLASLTGASPISAKTRFNEASLTEPLNGRSVSVLDGVLQKRAPPRPVQPDDPPKTQSAPNPDDPKGGWALLETINLPDTFGDLSVPLVPNSASAPASEQANTKPDANKGASKLETRQQPGTQEQHQWAYSAYRGYIDSDPRNNDKKRLNKHRDAILKVSNDMLAKYPTLFSGGDREEHAINDCNIWVREGKLLVDPDAFEPALDMSMLTPDLDRLWTRIEFVENSGMDHKKMSRVLGRTWLELHPELQTVESATEDSYLVRENLRFRMEGRANRRGPVTPGHIPSPRYSAQGHGQAGPSQQAQQPPALPQAGPSQQAQQPPAPPQAGPSRRDRNMALVRQRYRKYLDDEGLSENDAVKECVTDILLKQPHLSWEECEDAVRLSLQCSTPPELQ